MSAQGWTITAIIGGLLIIAAGAVAILYRSSARREEDRSVDERARRIADAQRRVRLESSEATGRAHRITGTGAHTRPVRERVRDSGYAGFEDVMGPWTEREVGVTDPLTTGPIRQAESSFTDGSYTGVADGAHAGAAYGHTHDPGVGYDSGSMGGTTASDSGSSSTSDSGSSGGSDGGGGGGGGGE